MTLIRNGLQHARVWHLVDAKDKILGRLSARIALALRGKYKPFYSPQADVGDYVVVVNAAQIGLSGSKRKTKEYFWHTGYPGGGRIVPFDRYSQEHPTGPIHKAVYGMLPKNNLRHVQMKRLLVFPDDQHPYGENILKLYEKDTLEWELEDPKKVMKGLPLETESLPKV